MGVTIKSKNYSADMGYNGFNRLRLKVAELTNSELFEHYKELNDAMFLHGESRDIFFQNYNKKISEIEENYNIKRGVLDFLYASDCNGYIPFTKCKHILSVINNYNDYALYGYIGREDCATFNDFKLIINDCVDNKCKMEWF